MMQDNIQTLFGSEEDMISLDFNFIYQSNRFSREQRNSVYLILNKLKNQNVSSWATKIKVPENPFYQYPANLELAQIHQQSFYLQPNSTFLKNNPDIKQCDCCKQQIRRQSVNWIVTNLYELMVDDYGISFPLYFSITKFQIIILLIAYIIFGLYEQYQFFQVCSDLGQKLMYPKEDYCLKGIHLIIAPQAIVLEYLQKLQTDTQLQIYLILSYIVFCIIMISPFIIDILIKAKKITYWNQEMLNHLRFEQQSLYVKHLPRKLTQEEIQNSIFSALQKKQKSPNEGISKQINILFYIQNSLFEPQVNAIKEILYIYDVHPIMEENKIRINTLLKLLISSEKIKKIMIEIQNDANQNKKLKKKQREQLEQLRIEFTQLVLQLMIQTKKIQQYLKAGLPYTNKIFLKFNTQEQTEAVYNHFKLNFFTGTLNKLKILWSSRKELKMLENQGFQEELKNSLLKDYTLSESSVDNEKSLDLSEFGQQANENIEDKPSKNTLSQLLLSDLIQVHSIDREAEQKLRDEQEAQKHIFLTKGYRQDDIFWENLGMHNLKGFILSLTSFFANLISAIITMGLFEILFFVASSYSIDKVTHQLHESELMTVNQFISIFFQKVRLKYAYFDYYTDRSNFKYPHDIFYKKKSKANLH